MAAAAAAARAVAVWLAGTLPTICAPTTGTGESAAAVGRAGAGRATARALLGCEAFGQRFKLACYCTATCKQDAS